MALDRVRAFGGESCMRTWAAERQVPSAAADERRAAVGVAWLFTVRGFERLRGRRAVLETA